MFKMHFIISPLNTLFHINFLKMETSDFLPLQIFAVWVLDRVISVCFFFSLIIQIWPTTVANKHALY